MRIFRSVVILGFLCGLSFAPLPGRAAPKPERTLAVQSAHRGFLMPELVGKLLTLLRSVSEKTGCAIDPLGRCVPATTTEQEPICPGDNTQTCQDWR